MWHIVAGVQQGVCSVVQHDLDELTHSGAAINDLEVQLTRTKDLYRRTLLEGRARVNQLAKKLHSHIIKSETFVQIWRKAKEVTCIKYISTCAGLGLGARANLKKYIRRSLQEPLEGRVVGVVIMP